MDHQRFAIYFAPRPSALADATAAWLGWDCQTGSPRSPAPGMPLFPPDVTEAPRKYGFHGTLKAPFRLAPGRTRDGLESALSTLAGQLAPVILPGMGLARLGGFLALTPQGDEAGLSHLAAEVVRQLEPFRAPLSDSEIARRKPGLLSARQRAHLLQWGYPHVMEEFRFHLTLTGALDLDVAEAVESALQAWLLPLVPRPFPIEDLCLFGEARDGLFHLLARHALTG